MLQQLDILLIENDPAMAYLTREALREAGLVRGLTSIPNGDDAISYLRADSKYRERNHPDIIFLDLHLPRRSGFDVLQEIKSNSKLALTPVVVISGSANPDEIRKAYELHASCYIRKPNDLEQFLHFMRICFQFWGSVVTLPAAS